jgi:soluble P-type ATPase
LGLDVVIAKNAAEKQSFVRTLDSENLVAVWNARIDKWMFDEAAVSIATLQAEWIHASILWYVDILVPSMADALQLFLDPNRFAATMKI